MPPILSMTVSLVILSLLAVGGINTVLPEMHREFVTVHGWMNDTEFADLFVIAQAAPGPNLVIMVTTIGWQVGGLLGTLAAFAAITVPGSVACYAVYLVWERFREAPWRIRLQASLAPVAIGVMVAAIFVVMQAADRDWQRVVITLATFAVTYFTRFNPLWMLALGALAGVVGLA